MKLGHKLRRIHSISINSLKQSFNIFYYLFWILCDFSKFDPKPKKINNLLVVSLGALGDSYNLLGFLNQIPEKYPKKKIYYLTSEKNKSFIKNPKIKRINLKGAKRLIDERKIDSALLISNPFGLFDREMYKKFRKIPYVVGVNDFPILPLIREIIPKKKFFLKINYLIFQKPHYKDNWPRAFKKLGFDLEGENLQFYFTKAGEGEAKQYIAKNKKYFPKKVIFLHPGSGTLLRALGKNKIPSHVWPNEKWAKLADLLILKNKTKIIFTGSEGESSLVEEIRSKMQNQSQSLNTSGKLSIEALAYLMKVTGKFLVSIDTGMAHIGALCGIFVIDLFGPDSPKIASPLSKRKKIIFKENCPCTTCRKYFCPEKNPICMKSITLKEIFEATNNLK